MRGGGTTGCLFSLLLIGAFAYAAYQLVPIYWHNQGFKDDVDGLVRRVSVRQINEEKLITEILDFAGRHEIPLKKDNIRITKLSDRIRVEVQYDREFKSPVYSKVFHFQWTVESFLGAL